jgi:hypothetical protein
MGRRRRDDDDFDLRLENEIITDAMPDELWIGWLCRASSRTSMRTRASKGA